MKKLIIGLLLIASITIVVVAITSNPKKAHCAWCYTGKCMNNSICGTGCVCLKKGMDFWGECYSF